MGWRIHDVENTRGETNEETNERQAANADAPAALLLVNDWERSKEHIQLQGISVSLSAG
jgi:hypothetical protein